VGAAITNRRLLGRTEAGTMAAVGAVLLAITAIGVLWPMVLAVPIVFIAGWMGLALLLRAFGLYRRPPTEDMPGADTQLTTRAPEVKRSPDT
jgi:cardiolipin synthase